MNTCTHTIKPSLTEEMVVNTSMLPEGMKDWRHFRIEYGFECGCPEGRVWLPPDFDFDLFERMLNE